MSKIKFSCKVDLQKNNSVLNEILSIKSLIEKFAIEWKSWLKGIAEVFFLRCNIQTVPGLPGDSVPSEHNISYTLLLLPATCVIVHHACFQSLDCIFKILCRML